MRFLWSFLHSITLGLLVILSWATLTYHYSILPPPVSAEEFEEIKNRVPQDFAQWIDKGDSQNESGTHQLVVKGKPFVRGWAAGQLSKNIMLEEENELIDKFNKVFPNRFLQRVFEVVAIRWFWGLDSYINPEHLKEMYGYSFSAAKKYDYLLSPYTRQIAYHGLHEVGQMMVDQKGDDMGCTVLAVSFENNWVLGRNFDFEGGRAFDDEKIMKWVFPEKGYAFLSVIWAGMVGAVTGVNEHGLYISMNAAGSTDYARYGTTTTLLLMEALQTKKTAQEAVKFLQQSKVFITDIFVVSDRVTGKLFRVEKSPQFTEVLELKEPAVITNHLHSKRWENDTVNQFRKTMLTSHYREASGKRVLNEISQKKFRSAKDLEVEILKGLRDKISEDGQPYHLGNRRAIDGLITTHSVIYNQADNVFFVSRYPGANGRFDGFDLTKSFAEKKPIVVRSLESDKVVTTEIFLEAKRLAADLSQAQSLVKRKKCTEAGDLIHKHDSDMYISSDYYRVLGDQQSCLGDLQKARLSWERALALLPAYSKDENYLIKQIGEQPEFQDPN